jgi:hypothetical protein
VGPTNAGAGSSLNDHERWNRQLIDEPDIVVCNIDIRPFRRTSVHRSLQRTECGKLDARWARR